MIHFAKLEDLAVKASDHNWNMYIAVHTWSAKDQLFLSRNLTRHEVFLDSDKIEPDLIHPAAPDLSTGFMDFADQFLINHNLRLVISPSFEGHTPSET